jgi:hypothetical protein
LLEIYAEGLARSGALFAIRTLAAIQRTWHTTNKIGLALIEYFGNITKLTEHRQFRTRYWKFGFVRVEGVDEIVHSEISWRGPAR